jgi:hypothetical protein
MLVLEGLSPGFQDESRIKGVLLAIFGVVC